MKTMMLLSLVAAFLLQTVPAAPVRSGTVQPGTARPITALTPIHRRDMRCAALFAIVSSAQANGVAYAAAYPPLALRGRAYFADVGQRVVEQTGQPKEAVQQEFIAVAWAIQDEIRAARAPGQAIAKDMAVCLPLLPAADAAQQPGDAAETAVP